LGLSNHPLKDLKFLKFSFLMLKFKKYMVRRFAPSPVSVLDKFPHGERFFSPYSKIFRRVVNLKKMTSMQNINKNLRFSPWGLAKDKLFILWLEDLPHGERFLPYGEKNLLPCGNVS
jgi:hypothetical protein